MLSSLSKIFSFVKVTKRLSTTFEEDVGREKLFATLTKRADEARRKNRILEKKLAVVRREREITDSTLGEV